MKHFFLLTLLSVVLIGCSPLRDSEEQITERLLEQTPLQTSKNVVRTQLAGKKLLTSEQQGPPSLPVKHPFRTKEWNSLFRVKLGGYGFLHFDLLSTDVVAFYVFDKEDRLIEIAVVKYHEGL